MNKTMNRLEALEKLTEIQYVIDFAQKQIDWRLKDIVELDLNGLPKVKDRYNREVKSKQDAIKRLEQRFQRILKTL